MGDEGLVAIAESEFMANLIRLYLEGNKYGEVGEEALKDSEILENLEFPEFEVEEEEEDEDDEDEDEDDEDEDEDDEDEEEDLEDEKGENSPVVQTLKF